MEKDENQNINGEMVEINSLSANDTTLKEKLSIEENVKIPNSPRKFQIGKFDDNLSLNLNKKEAFVHTNFHRFIHFSFAFVLFSTTLIASIFFGANAKSNSINKLALDIKGNVSIVDNYKNINTFDYESGISGGEIIATEKNSELKIKFENQSEIRLQELTKIKIDNLAYPKIELIDGQMWVFSPNKIEVEIPNAKFVVENSSANFTKNNKIYEITSWRHNVRGTLITSDNEKIIDFILPLGKRMFFAPSQITKEFSRLRFSKLKKELKFHKASPIDWENENIKTDESIIFAITTDNAIKIKTASFLSNGSLRLKKLHKQLTFLPTKKKDIKNQLNDLLIRKAIKNASNGDTEQLKNTLVSSKFNNKSFEEIWHNTLLLSSEENFLKSRWEIENIWLNSNLADKKILYRKFLSASLNLIENFTKNREGQLLAQESSRYQDLWKKYNSISQNSDNEIFMQEVAMHRESIFNISQYFVDRVDSEMLKITAYVDDIALVNEKENSQDILRLEIAQENLALIEKFIKEERFLLAREIIDQADKRLKLETVPEIFAIREKILATKNLVNEQIKFAIQKGNLNQQDFERYLADIESTERLLEELGVQEENILNEVEIEVAKIENDEEILEKVRELFIAEDIILYSFDFDENSREKFEIHRAGLKNGKAFSATFNLGNNSISNIKFESGEELSGGFFISDLHSLAERFFAENSSTTEVDSLHASADEIDNYDSTLVSLLKQLTQKKLEEVGITVSQKNISIVSRQKTQVDSATVDEFKLKISFLFDTKTMDCTNIVVETIELPDTKLDQLIELVTNNIEKKEKLDNLKDEVKKDFQSFGFAFQMDVNVVVDLEKEIARFSNISFSKNNETFAVFGAYNIKNKIFEIISEKNGKFKTFNQVELQNLEKEVLDSYEQEKSNIENKNQKNLSASLLGSTWYPEQELKNITSNIFKKNSCGFDASRFEIDEKNQKVVFREVWCNKMEIFGEYNADNEIFTILFNPEYGSEREMDLEDFMEILNNFNETKKNEMMKTPLSTTDGMINKLSGLFSVYGCEFNENSFEASVEKQVVNFKNVLFNNQKISGVYDVSNEIFKSVSCDAFGTKTNITIEDLSTKISERELGL